MHGHGANFAGIIAPKVFESGIDALFIAVKVIPTNFGSMNRYVYEGIEWTIHSHFYRSLLSRRRSIINLSLESSEVDPYLDYAVEQAVRSGIHVVVAAGNHNVDACGIVLMEQSKADCDGPSI